MSHFGTVYTYPNNPRVMKIQAAGNLNSLSITTSPDFQMGVTNRSPEYLSKFPMGKAPAFEGADGTLLFESDAIAQYVAESGPAKDQLLGVSAAERAHIRQWICFAEGDAMGAVVPFAIWQMGLRKYTAEELEEHLAKAERALGAVEAHLKTGGGRKWLATEEKLSLADISLVAALNWGFATVLDAGCLTSWPLKAWGGSVGEIELGGVGNMVWPKREESRPPEVKAERGLGISTEAVLPASAIAMLEVVV